MLAVRGLQKAYGGRVALAGVDLDVGAGEIVGLLGPNGAGKTTLVSIVAGLRPADAGSVTVGGIDALRRPRDIRRVLGFAPQETGVYPSLTCDQNLRFFGELAGLRGGELRRACDGVAEALGLTELLERRAQQLSGGERRRLHTALALVHRPALVLLDEPTTGSDVQTRAQLLELVKELAARGSAIVYSTHYLGEIEQLGASVAIIEHGRNLARGSVADLIAAHADTVIELSFSGQLPDIPELPGTRVTSTGSVVRALSRDVGATTVAMIAALGSRVRDIESFEVIRPSLETVFLQLTGRRYAADANQDARDVA